MLTLRVTGRRVAGRRETRPSVRRRFVTQDGVGEGRVEGGVSAMDQSNASQNGSAPLPCIASCRLR